MPSKKIASGRADTPDAPLVSGSGNRVLVWRVVCICIRVMNRVLKKQVKKGLGGKINVKSSDF